MTGRRRNSGGKATGKGSTQRQHLVQTEVPTKLLEEWLAMWTKIQRKYPYVQVDVAAQIPQRTGRGDRT